MSTSEQPDRLTYSVHALDPHVLTRSAVGKKRYPASVMSDGRWAMGDGRWAMGDGKLMASFDSAST